MKYTTMVFGLLLGFATLVGCDNTKSHESSKYKTDDGTVVKEDKKVTQDRNGDTKVTHEKSVDRP
jgi:hypothetical protein